MQEVVWESLYQRGIEHLTLDDTHADSVIATEQFGLRYSIDCDARWNFQRAEIVCGQRRNLGPPRRPCTLRRCRAAVA